MIIAAPDFWGFSQCQIAVFFPLLVVSLLDTRACRKFSAQ